MKNPTLMRWVVGLLLSLLITGSLLSLAITYFLYLPMLSRLPVRGDDRWVIERASTIATGVFFRALISGLILGICLPVAYRWAKSRREVLGATSAEPGAAPNGGPATPSANPNAREWPPSVS